MPPKTLQIKCLIWPAYGAELSTGMDFYVDSLRSGGCYEFHLPNFGIDLPELTPQNSTPADSKPVQMNYAAYNMRITKKMLQVLDKYRNKKHPGLFEAFLSRWIYIGKESVFEITPGDLKLASDLSKTSGTLEKTRDAGVGFLASYLAQNPNIPNGHFEWQRLGAQDYAREAMAASYCRDFGELVQTAVRLEEEGHIKLRKYGDEGRIAVKVTPKLLDAYGAPASVGANNECFVAMSFAKELKLDVLYDAIRLGAERAGYRAVRVDRVEHINKIDDEIIARIRGAKFVIADLTGQNQGVYYEAGFAHGEQRKIIYTCESAEMKKVHFDINHYNILTWEEAQLRGDGKEGLARRLQNRIEAVFGKGNYKPDEQE